MLKKNLVKYYEYFAGIVFVYANESWLEFEYKVPIMALQLVAIIGYVLIQSKINNRLSFPNPIIVFLAIYPFLCKLFNLDTNAEVLNTASVSIIYLSLGFLALPDIESLLDKYARVIYFLCLVTLVLGPVTLLDYSILRVLPVHYNHNFIWDDFGYYNLIIFTERYVQDFRTQSIYWEPGAWSFNMVFAFYWLIIVKEEYKKLPYMIFGLILACSTTGLFLLVLMLVYIIIKSKDNKVKNRVWKLLIFSFVLLAAAVVYISYNTNIDIGNLLYDQTIGKFTGKSEATAISFTQRAESTQKAFSIALKNPFFGIGKLGVDDILFVTSSLAEIAYQLGLVYLVVYVFIYRKLFSKLGIVFSFIFALIMLNGEPYSYWILCSLILMYGAKLTFVELRAPTLEPVHVI